jgi:hypothetical protein
VMTCWPQAEPAFTASSEVGCHQQGTQHLPDSGIFLLQHPRTTHCPAYIQVLPSVP